MTKRLGESIPLSERYIDELVHKTGHSAKFLRTLMMHEGRQGTVIVFYIRADRKWPRTRY